MMGNERFLDQPEPKPPVGLRPRDIAVASRIQEIEDAMRRYMDAHVLIPTEWFAEYEELRELYLHLQIRKG
jgi:hypothetical protein